MRVSKDGFAALETHVLDWIKERHPSVIPQSIMALAPDNASEAIERYFIALRRGYLDV